MPEDTGRPINSNPTNERDVSLRDYIEARFVEVERSVAREVAVLRTLMAEHAAAHAREHTMSEQAILKAQETIEARFRAERESTLQMFSQIQRAVDKSEATMADRFSSVNEFRSSLSDLGATMARRDFVDQVQDALEKMIHTVVDQLRGDDEKNRVKIETLEKDGRFSEGRTIGISLAVSGVITIVGIGLSVLFFLLR